MGFRDAYALRVHTTDAGRQQPHAISAVALCANGADLSRPSKGIRPLGDVNRPFGVNTGELNVLATQAAGH